MIVYSPLSTNIFTRRHTLIVELACMSSSIAETGFDANDVKTTKAG